MVQHWSRRTTRFCPWPIVVFNLYNLSDGLTTNSRLFADDVSLFSLFDNINPSKTNLNSDLSKINVWANQWELIQKALVQKAKTRSYFFLVKLKRDDTLHWSLIIPLFSKYSFKNTWAFIWTVSWTLKNIFKTYLKKISKIICLLRKL